MATRPVPNLTPQTRPIETEDQFLRRMGFRIHARPANGPAIWARKWLRATHAEALTIARRESKNGV